MTDSPPGRRSRAPQEPGTDTTPTGPIVNQPDDIPWHRPWARRRDAVAIERRFRIDQQCWRRRIDAARRLAHDGADDIAPYDGHWTSQWAPLPREQVSA